MSALGKRLDALDRIAAECRLREIRGAIGDEIMWHSREHGLAIAPGELEAKIDRAMAVMETAAVLLASGLTMEGVARHLAVQHDLDTDRVVAIYREVRATRGAPP